MSNLSSIFKSETSRIARREVRAEVQGLRKAVTAHRTEIADLKRRLATLDRALRALARERPAARGAASAAAAAGAGTDASATSLRFSAKGLLSQRQRLGLSARDCGLLVGTSGQSIYLWEAGKVRPRASHLPAIAALRRMGKREATARLAALREQAE